MNPSLVSLNLGATAQLSAVALNGNNQTIGAPDIAYHSDNPNVISISNTGLICAGQWDANFQVCHTLDNSGAAIPPGKANITATATVANTVVTSSTVVVYDHQRIDSVQVAPTSGGPFDFSTNTACVSQNGTAQFTAKAFNKDLGQLDPASIGAVNWAITPVGVATLDNTIHLANAPLTVTAFAPGRGTVTASIGNVGFSAVSGSALFTTCPVSRIHIRVQNPTAPDTDFVFSKAKGTSVTLAADVSDTIGNPLTSTLSLTWTSSAPTLVSVSNGQVGTLAPGTASLTASCTPPSCNANLTQITGAPFAVYSDDVVTANVTGTPVSTVFIVSSAKPPTNTSNNIVPIDTATNNPGTPFTLPENLQPNSFALTPQGTSGFLGTNQGLLNFNPAVATLGNPATAITGAILATDGNRIVVSDATNHQTSIVSAATSSDEAVLPITATSAAIAPNGSKIYLSAGTGLFDYTPGFPLRQLLTPLSPTASPQQLAFYATGAMAYAATAGDESVESCTDAMNAVGGSGSPTHIARIPNGAGMLDVDGTTGTMDEVDVNSNGSCPPTVNTTGVTSHDLGVGTFTPKQLIVTRDSSLAIVLTSDKGILLYDIAAKQAKPAIALSGGAVPLSGDVTPDAANLYVGANDGKVHRIDLKAGSDAQTITPASLCAAGTTGCNPDFVAVNPAQVIATVTKITVAPANSTIKVGQTQNFTATATFSDNTTRDITSFVTWASTNPVVATIIFNTGQATGLAAGTTTITATFSNATGSTVLTVQ